MCAAAVSHLRVHGEHDAGPAHGGKVILIPNPRDFPGRAQGAEQHTFHSFPAVNTLFGGLANHPDFNTVNWSNLKGLGRRWHGGRAAPPCSGWRKPAAPSARLWPVRDQSVGQLQPDHQHRLQRQHRRAPCPTLDEVPDDEGHEVPQGQPGEIAIKGPQVMAGYWQRPDETAKVPDARRVLPNRRCGRDGRARLLQNRGPQEGHDPVRRLQCVPQRDRDVVSTPSPACSNAPRSRIPDEKAVRRSSWSSSERTGPHRRAIARPFAGRNLTGHKQPKGD